MPELIEQVRAGEGDPCESAGDSQSRDAPAARGYWQAFQLVRKNLSEAAGGANPGELARSVHRDWYREMFQPSVAAGMPGASALAGFRILAVFIPGSRHAPPRWKAVRDAVPALFVLLKSETEPSVRAVLGHWLFGYIRPCPDGGGRIARLVMNVMLTPGGCPWTAIRVEHSDDCLAARERASSYMDVQPFAPFIADRVYRSMMRDA